MPPAPGLPARLPEPVWRNGKAYDSGPRCLGFETRLGQLVILLGKVINCAPPAPGPVRL